MSTQGHGTDISLLAGADLSAAQFKAVKVNSSGAVVLAGAGETAIGILQNNPGNGQAATVRVLGITKASADAAIAAGALVTSSADGQVTTATKASVNTSDAGVAADAVAGSNVLGVALNAAAAAGEIISVLVLHAGAVPTTAA